MANYPEGEKQEMIELYQKRGMTLEDATSVIGTLAKYPDLFVDVVSLPDAPVVPMPPRVRPERDFRAE